MLRRLLDLPLLVILIGLAGLAVIVGGPAVAALYLILTARVRPVKEAGWRYGP